MRANHHSHTWSWPLIGLACLALVGTTYILSPVPVFWVLMQFPGGEDAVISSVESFYAPLVWACDKSPAVRDFYDWLFSCVGSS